MRGEKERRLAGRLESAAAFETGEGGLLFNILPSSSDIRRRHLPLLPPTLLFTRPCPPCSLRRRLWKLLQVARVFTDGVVVGIVDHPQLPHHLPPNGRFYRPVVHFTVLLLPVQLLHVEDLGGEPVQDDPNVFDAEVVLLVDRELVHQQEKLV